MIEPSINARIVERADYIYADTLLHEGTTEEVSEEVKEFFEQNHITRLDELITNMDKREMITVCAVAVRKYPLAYMQVLAERIIELTRKGRKQNEKH